MSAGLGIGLGLVVLSLAMIVPVLIVVWWRRLPHQEASAPATVSSFVPLESSHTNEAILIVQAGGRVEYINSLARDWFGLHPEEPTDLERLIRRARPAEELLNLFAHPGQKRLSISGRLVEATSYQVPGPYPLMLVLMRSVELATNLSEVGTNSSILQIVSDFGRNVSASLDLEDTLYALLLNVSQLVPADIIEVKVFDEFETDGYSLYIRILRHGQGGECRAFPVWQSDRHIENATQAGTDPGYTCRRSFPARMENYFAGPILFGLAIAGRRSIRGHPGGGASLARRSRPTRP